MNSTKINCSFCSKEIECPEDMLDKVEKHACFDCFDKLEENMSDEEIEKIHVDIPQDKFNETIADKIVSHMMKGFFPTFWQKNKEDFKELSKKEIAETMFEEGAYLATRSLMDAMKKEVEKFDNSQ